jgi:hypothetical protein
MANSLFGFIETPILALKNLKISYLCDFIKASACFALFLLLLPDGHLFAEDNVVTHNAEKITSNFQDQNLGITGTRRKLMAPD